MPLGFCDAYALCGKRADRKTPTVDYVAGGHPDPSPYPHPLGIKTNVLVGHIVLVSTIFSINYRSVSRPTHARAMQMLNETNIKEYLLSNIKKEDGPIEGSQCWIFTGPRTSQGYGQVYYGGHMQGVHRLAYTAWVGPLPPWAKVQHACGQRGCLNPDHLQSQRAGCKVPRIK